MSSVSVTWGNLTFFTELQVAAIQGSAGPPVDASQGSLTLALVEGVDGATLWLQAETISVMLLTRAATSSGLALDSWMADWSFYRLAASASAGTATFTSFTPDGQRLVPVGTGLTTAPGGPQFVVIPDTSNPDYSALLNAYVMADGVPTVDAAIMAVAAGSAGNAMANSIVYFSAAPPAGIDTVNNADALEGGTDAESDDAFRARFALYIQSLREATVLAIKYWVVSIQAGITCNLVENLTEDGGTRNGFFYCVVDDGTGDPPDSLITTASETVDVHRGASISFAVYKPTIVTSNLVFALTTAAGTNHAAAVAAVATALTGWLNAQPVGSTLSYNRLFQVIFDASSAVIGVPTLTVNGGTSDLVLTPSQVVKAGTVTGS